MDNHYQDVGRADEIVKSLLAAWGGKDLEKVDEAIEKYFDWVMNGGTLPSETLRDKLALIIDSAGVHNV